MIFIAKDCDADRTVDEGVDQRDDASAACETSGTVRLLPAVIVGMMLSIGHVNHAVVASLACFAGLMAGASFCYADWLAMLGLVVVGNMVGDHQPLGVG